MDNQLLLLKALRKKVGETVSLIENVASVLGISYDAAHRRVSRKSKFSIEETVALCRHFSISMDSLFTDGNSVIMQKTKEIRLPDDMAAYFRDSSAYIGHFLQYQDTKMYYSAKDIPLFYTMGGTLLSKFKMYVWLNLLTGTPNQEAFENFTLDISLSEYTGVLKKVHESVEVNEVWNDTTINSTLQQIRYYFVSGLLSLSNALLLFDDMKDILNSAEERCCNSNTGFNLYYNELLILNNNVLISAPGQQSLFVPYTMLGYFITGDKTTCTNALGFFRHQVANSKLLNTSGTRDRKQFFNKMHGKIDFYIQRINSEINPEF